MDTMKLTVTIDHMVRSEQKIKAYASVTLEDAFKIHGIRVIDGKDDLYVTMSSTADGSLNGDPAATKMSVTVPTVLPIAVGTDGTVSTATDAKIVNNSFGAVKVNSVSIEAVQGWSLAAFGDKATLAHEKVNSNKFGFSLSLGNGSKKK